jgi:hypothetical protein
MIATKEAACRHKSSSEDPTGLGRWTSMLISGRHGHNVHYVCAYNPCKTTNINGNYLQQQRYFQSHDDIRDPLEIFRKDIAKAIAEWLADDEHLVVMMDANEHVSRGRLSKVFKDLGLHESIIAKHSNLHRPVATW